MVDKKKIAEANSRVEAEVARRRRTVRNFPASTFEEALEFAKEIHSFGSGQPVRRLSSLITWKKRPKAARVDSSLQTQINTGSLRVATRQNFSNSHLRVRWPLTRKSRTAKEFAPESN